MRFVWNVIYYILLHKKYQTLAWRLNLNLNLAMNDTLKIIGNSKFEWNTKYDQNLTTITKYNLATFWDMATLHHTYKPLFEYAYQRLRVYLAKPLKRRQRLDQFVFFLNYDSNIVTKHLSHIFYFFWTLWWPHFGVMLNI